MSFSPDQVRDAAMPAMARAMFLGLGLFGITLMPWTASDGVALAPSALINQFGVGFALVAAAALFRVRRHPSGLDDARRSLAEQERRAMVWIHAGIAVVITAITVVNGLRFDALSTLIWLVPAQLALATASALAAWGLMRDHATTTDVSAVPQ